MWSFHKKQRLAESKKDVLIKIGALFVAVLIFYVAIVAYKARRPPNLLSVATKLQEEVRWANSYGMPVLESSKHSHNYTKFDVPYVMNDQVATNRGCYEVQAFANCNKYAVREEKELFQRYKEKLLNLTEPPLPFERGTRGIVVTCALNELCLANLLMLRYTHYTQVPVELWVESQQLTQQMSDMLDELFGSSVIVRFLDDYEQEYTKATTPLVLSKRHRRSTYRFKLLAMVASRFEQVLLLDLDAYLLQSPEKVLDRCAQENSGGVFWRDISQTCRENPVWDIIGTKFMSGCGQESGIVYVNKAVAWRGLYLAAYMNQRQGVFYNVLLGDKDTFNLGYENIGDNYTWVPYIPYILKDSPSRKDVGVSFLQPDLDGVPLAVHLVSGKRIVLNHLETGTPFFTHTLAYDPNTHVVVKDLFLKPNRNQKDTAHTEPAESYISNFPEVLTTHYHAAWTFLHSNLTSLDPQEDSKDALIDPLS